MLPLIHESSTTLLNSHLFTKYAGRYCLYEFEIAFGSVKGPFVGILGVFWRGHLK